ncbi:MAG: M17 family peptidase N-terminal domain-containing protein, partial [Bdellovibrionales bacterium]
MKVVLQKGPKTDLNTLVVFFAKNTKSSKSSGAKLSSDMQKLVDSAMTDAGFSGDRKESVFYRDCGVNGYKNILLVGLGESSSVDAEALRVAGAHALGALKNHKLTSAAILGDSLLKNFKDSAVAIQAFVEGFELSAYDFSDFKSKKKNGDKKDKPKLEQVSLLLAGAPTAAQQKALKRAETLVECQNFTRWLG